MKKTYLTLLLLLSAVISFAQSVTGKIVNQKDEPIPYATIQIGDHYGVVSNTEGYFTIKTKNQPEDAQVQISFMGYKTLEIPLADFVDDTYILEEDVNELDEVLVTNKQLTPEEIITNMLEKAPENYEQKNFQQTFFVRNNSKEKIIDFDFEIDKATDESKKDLRKLNEEIEAFSEKMKGQKFQYFTEYYGSYARLNDSSKVNVDKFVYLKDEDEDISQDKIIKKVVNIFKEHLDKDASYKFKLGMFKVEDSLTRDEIFDEETDSTKGKSKYVKNSIFYKNLHYNNFYNDDDLDFFNKMKRYQYQLDGYTNIDGESVYIISFSPDRGSASFYGKMYINVFDYGLMRLDYTMMEGEKLHNINLKLLGFKVQQDRIKVTSIYKKKENGKYSIKFGKRQSGTYAYVSLPAFKFIKNRVDRDDDRQKLKLDMMIEQDNLSTTEFYVINEGEIDQTNYDTLVDQEDYEYLELETYDPTVWADYNVLAPIDDIKNYGKDNTATSF
ncbi:CarboxypepD_reg-like domain-containing protein [Pustulibacterium marinum]|uniref:CarboxypepD_reg-like domain-containing protein n=1 Tax=Pustulibacterium marinum TaxID=1224947 RepID=A0A1I7G2G5_9FLAO|nr:carboxypeptidase-like regulatory domain-containing protein [Pustulibacterium marinum]SFU42603.1 CarboxypepD_reg-like domain-containing protein [Pustulibacterium marinum]